jgi:hypothetical protein
MLEDIINAKHQQLHQCYSLTQHVTETVSLLERVL